MEEPTLNQKLGLIQEALKVPKNIDNNYAGFKYRNVEGIEEAVKPLLAEHQLTLRFTDAVVEVGNRLFVKASAILEDGSGTIIADGYAELQPKAGTKMSEPQLTGSSSSYARKYAAGGLFLIDDSKDDPDSRDNAEVAKVAQEEKKKEQEEAKELKEFSQAKSDLNKMMDEAGLNTVKKKMAISAVLDKSTVDTLEDAEKVMDSLVKEVR